MWQTPKTDWFGQTSADGTYTGDRFNAGDYNRIKNNLNHLRDLAIRLHDTFSLSPMGNDRSPADYFYADEINRMTENLQTINRNTFSRAYGTFPLYVANGKTMTYGELNQIEQATADLYDLLTNELQGRRTLAWNLGTGGGL